MVLCPQVLQVRAPVHAAGSQDIALAGERPASSGMGAAANFFDSSTTNDCRERSLAQPNHCTVATKPAFDACLANLTRIPDRDFDWGAEGLAATANRPGSADRHPLGSEWQRR